MTCTPAKEPYVKKEFIRPGTFIAAVGADSPDKKELENTLVSANKVVVDLPEQCAKVGELHHALDAGLMKIDDIYGTLGEITAGKMKGRVSHQEIIIFDTTGTAIQDAAGAALCYEKAVQEGVGTYLNLNC